MRPATRLCIAARLCIALSLLPMTVAVASPLGESEPRFRRLGAEDGLSQASVYAIVQDRRGFMWLGTQDGLHRFDGERFVVLRPQPFGDESLSHGLVQALAEDADGRLWAGTFRGLNRLRPQSGSFDVLLGGSSRASGPAATIEDLAVGDDGSLWVATRDDGLFRVSDPGDLSRVDGFRHDPDDPASLPDDQLRSVAASPDGLWIGTDDGRVDRFNALDDGSGGFEPLENSLLPGGTVQALLVDGSGMLWVGADGGLARIDPATGEGAVFRHDPADAASLSHDSVAALLEDADGRLWVGTLGGGLCSTEIYEDEPEDAGLAFHCYRHDPARTDSLSHDQVRALAQDAGGLIWAGTALGGVTLVDARPRLGVVRHAPGDPDGLPAKAVRAFAETTSDLWVGTDGGGVVRVAGAEGDRFRRPEVRPEFRTLADELATARIWSIFEDASGTLWVGGNERLWTYDAAGERLSALRHDPDDPAGIGPGSVRWMLEDDDGTLWLALFGGGVDARAPDGTFRHHRTDPDDVQSLVSDLALVLHRHSCGDLWVGTAEGLSRWWAPKGHFATYRHDPDERDSLLGDIVRAIHEDAEGNLWIGTNAGLNFLPVGVAAAPPGAGSNRFGFRHFTEDDGLPDHTVYAILEDDDGRLWLSTNRGLARFDPVTETFLSFDVEDGAQALEFNGGAQLRSSDGQLYFGGVDGYNVFRPGAVERNAHVPPVVVAAVRRQLRTEVVESAWPADEIVLDHRDRVVTFRFAALDFSHPEENRYAYRLDGVDAEGVWHDLGTENDLTLTQPDAGDYLLRVRGSNDDGVWNEVGTSMRVVVRSAPWFSWWAWTAYVGTLFLVLGYVALQVHRRRTLQQQMHQVVRTSERRLDLALRGSGDGLWDWDIATGEIYRSHVDSVMGGDAANLQVERPFADLEIHPDDLARVELELERHLEGASERFEVEYRLREPDGGWRWILDRGDVVERDDRGRPLRMAGTFKDMTRQKQVERELRLWQAVFESVSEGVVILDVWGRIRAANPAFCQLTGWRVVDLVGRRSSLLESRQHEAGFYRKVRRQLVDEGRWQGEVHQSQSQRGSFLAWVDINAVTDAAGQLTHFVVVCTDITRRKETEEELRRRASYDPLTGLPNRSQFLERLAEALVEARRQGHRVAVLFGDLDRFKQINDTLGHDVGDRLLQEAGRRLLRSVRERDVVSRLGGDEFTVLLSRVTEEGAVVTVADRILGSFATPFELGDVEVSVSTSLGIAIFPEDGDSAERLIKHADTAMYEAKTAGRNRYRFWDRQLSRRAMLRMNLEGRLRKALDDGELELHYQPKINVEEVRIVGLEALVRWRRDGDLVLPASFLALAEETGLMLTLGPWVLETALERLKGWPEGPTRAEPLHVSVNVSATELLREGYAGRVRGALDRRNVEPERLTLEISEPVVAENREALRDVLVELHDAGVRLSLDDFGTGHAALRLLRDLPFDEVKLDPAFAEDAGPTVLRSIFATAESLGLVVVAEGVETEERLRALRDLGCRVVQGFALSQPVPRGDVESLFADGAAWRSC